MSLSSVRQKGRKNHLSSELAPKVMTPLALAAGGMTFEDAAAEVDMSSDALRKWRKHPESQPFLEMVVSENFAPAKNLALSKAQRMIEILAEIAENQKNKPYSRVNAADKLLEKALKFDEAHFQRVELAKVREILEDSEADRNPIISIQSN